MKKIISLAMVLLLAFSVIGCGSDKKQTEVQLKDSGSVQDSSAEDSSAEDSSTKTDTSETKKELKGTINVNLIAGTGVMEAWEAVEKGYEALNPGVDVVIDLKPNDGYSDWVKNQFGDESPSADLVAVNLAGPASANKTINLLEYVQMDSPYSDGPWMDQFNYEMQVIDLNQGIMSYLSLESVQVLWLYNKGIFEEAGVQPPTTWNELIEVCEKIQAAGYQPLSVAGDFNSFWAGGMGWLSQIYADQTTRELLEVYRAQPGDFNYDEDIDGSFVLDTSDPYNDDAWRVNQNCSRAFKAIKDGVYRADSEGMKTVMKNLAKVFPKYAGGEAFFGTKDSLPLFYQGKAAIQLDGGWRIPSFHRDMKKLSAGEELEMGEETLSGIKTFELGTFNMPSMEGEGIVANARTIEVAVGFVGAIKKDQEHNDLVADFLMYYSSAEGYGKFFNALLDADGTPAGPSLVYGVELPEVYAKMFENTSFIGNAQKGFGAMIARGAPSDIQESLREWYGYTQEYFVGKIDVDEWAKRNQANIEKYFDDAMKATNLVDEDLENPQNEPLSARK